MNSTQMAKIGKGFVVAGFMAMVSFFSIVMTYGWNSVSPWSESNNNRPQVSAQDQVVSPRPSTKTPAVSKERSLRDALRHSTLTLNSLQSYPQVTLVGQNFSDAQYATGDGRHWSQKQELFGGGQVSHNNPYSSPREYYPNAQPTTDDSYPVKRAGFGAIGSNYQPRKSSSQGYGQYGGYGQAGGYVPSGSSTRWSMGGYGSGSGFGADYGGDYFSASCNGASDFRLAVDDSIRQNCGGRKWRHARPRPWENMAYGEYIGPYRTPHTYGDYLIRVNDILRFTLMRSHQPIPSYRLAVGDEIQVTPEVTDQNLPIPPTTTVIPQDGHIHLPFVGKVRAEGYTIEQLKKEIDKQYRLVQAERREESGDEDDGLDDEEIPIEFTVRPVRVGVKLTELIATVEARAGQGGNSVTQRVHPDGQIRLQGIPRGIRVNAIGMTLDDLEGELNLLYDRYFPGAVVKVALETRAIRNIFVLGEVNQSQRIELNGPTSLMQAIAQAGSFKQGADLKNIVVFRRDQNWRLVATKVDLSKSLIHGTNPSPDDIWLRDSDIIVVPKTRIQRISELVDLYFTRTAYAILPNQGFSFNFDNNSSL